MSPIRKKAFASVLVATALAIAALTASFIYLREQNVTDEAFVESKIQAVAADRNFKLEEARKEGYSDSEIASFLVKSNRAEFDRLWWRIFLTVSAIYAVLILGVFASTLVLESKGSESST